MALATPTMVIPVTKYRFYQAAGVVASGATLTVFQSDGSPAAIWTDSTQQGPSSNSVTLDSNGECALWLPPGPTYKFHLVTTGSSVVWTPDPVVISRQDPANVLDFGADPTGVTECHVFIQNALNSGARAVYFPSGTYKISSYLDVPSNITIFGDGAGTLIKYSFHDVSGFQIGHASTPTVSNVHIHDLMIDGGQTTDIYTGNYNCRGISIVNATGVVIDNVTIQNMGIMNGLAKPNATNYSPEQAFNDGGFSGSGIYILGSSQVSGAIPSGMNPLSNIRISNCTISNIAGGGNISGDGIFIGAGGGSGGAYNGSDLVRDIVISNCRVSNVGRHCYAIGSPQQPTTFVPSDVRIINCYGEKSALAGVENEQGYNTLIDGCVFYQCGTSTYYYNPINLRQYGSNYILQAGFTATSTCFNITVSNTHFDSCYYGFTFNAMTGLLVTGCKFENSVLSDVWCINPGAIDMRLVDCQFTTSNGRGMLNYRRTNSSAPVDNPGASFLATGCSFYDTVLVVGLFDGLFTDCVFHKALRFLDQSVNKGRITVKGCSFLDYAGAGIDASLTSTSYSDLVSVGPYFYTDLAATDGSNLNRVSSMSHAFVAGDKDSYLVIKSTTGNWKAGSYLITSVSGGVAYLSSNAATATASAGNAYLCGVMGGSYAYADLVTSIDTNKVTSTARPFSSADLGGSLAIPMATNWIAGTYSIISVSSGGTATLNAPVATNAVSPNTANLAKPLISMYPYGDLSVGSADNTQVSSIARPFSAFDVDNYLLIVSNSGGWTPGTYIIIGVSSSGVATLNASPGTASSTGGAGVMSTPTACPCVYTDLSTNGASTSQVISTVRPFGAADIGNLLQITSIAGGFNIGSYRIDNVIGGVATLHSAVCTTAPATGGAGFITKPTQVWSATRPFILADVFLYLNITGGTGFTPGIYQITGQARGIATLSSPNSVVSIGSSSGAATLIGQYPYSDLNINAITTHVSSTARPFVATDAGSLLWFTAGANVTLGLYTIISVAGGVATLDRSVGVNSPATDGQATLCNPSTDIIVSECQFRGAGNLTYGVNMGSNMALRWMISDCVFWKASKAGINHSNGNGLRAFSAFNNAVTATASGSLGHGIAVNGGISDCLIEGNVFDAVPATGWGITITGISSALTGMFRSNISNNISTPACVNGVTITAASAAYIDYSVIMGNNVHGCTGTKWLLTASANSGGVTLSNITT